jgi:hypothetical protein
VQAAGDYVAGDHRRRLTRWLGGAIAVDLARELHRP